MSTALLTAAADRPLAASMRADLELVRQTWRSRDAWVVKDPLALRYYRLEDEELSLLRLLDGRTSLRQLQAQFERDFAPQKISLAELQAFLARLHQWGLIVASAEDQGAALLARRKKNDARQRLGWLLNPLSLRFRGVDPGDFLDRLGCCCGWLFSAPGLCAAGLLVFSAVLLAAVQADELMRRLPAFRDFFAAGNWLWLAVALAGAKVLHELGHGLACHRFGARCHELGLMLLLGAPCLYCNVTDAWTLPSKWRRAAIGAAGVYVELLLAAAALWLWWLTQPGLVQALALNVVFVCSVSTLLFNANPLLRYDGYFVLADLLEVPNLRQKSQALLRRGFQRYVLGARLPPEPFLPPRRAWAYALFGAVSLAYGLAVTVSILWFLTRVLEPYGAEVLGRLLALLIGGGMLVSAAVQGWREVWPQPGRKAMHRLRAAAGLAGVAAVIGLVLLTPLPHYIPCPGLIEPQGATAVYVETAGSLRAAPVTRGTVQAGQTLAVLDDADARLQLTRLRGERDRIAARREGLTRQALADQAALAALAATEETLETLNQQLEAQAAEVARLTIKAPVSGTFWPAAARAERAAGGVTLAGWSGRPLDARNVGAFLPAGTLVGRIGDPARCAGQLLVNQDALEFVQLGQRVDFYPACTPGACWRGTVSHISSQEVESPPPALTEEHGGPIRLQTGPSGERRCDGVYYVVQVEFAAPQTGWPASGAARAKIHTGYRSLGSHLWRLALQTVRWG